MIHLKKDLAGCQSRKVRIAAAREITGKVPQVAGADSGYYSGEKLQPMAEVAGQILVPAREQVHPSKAKAFGKEQFRYLAQENVSLCPAGKRLTYLRSCPKRGWWEYRLEGEVCCACEHKGPCTRSGKGRTVIRYFNEDLRQRAAGRGLRVLGRVGRTARRSAASRERSFQSRSAAERPDLRHIRPQDNRIVRRTPM